MKTLFAICAASVLLGVTAGSAKASTLRYSLATVPAIAGTDALIPTSINSIGQVVGYAYVSGGDRQAFIGTTTGSSLIPTLGGARSEATSINDHGQVVGWSMTETPAEFRPFFYTPSGALTNLGTLGGRSSFASAISNAGLIVGHSSTSLPFDSEYAAFSASPASAPVRIDFDPIETTGSFAYAVNDSGAIVGSLYSLDYSRSYAFLHSGAGTLLLPGLGGNHASATAINALGRLVGSASDANGDGRAFLFDGTQTINLGTIAGKHNLGYGLGTAAWSGAYGINSAGVIVGGFGFSGYQGRGFVYDGTTMLDLNELLAPEALGTWEITDALAINENGVIAAYGYRIGEYVGTAILLTPIPEPSTLAMFLLGIVGVVVGRRQAIKSHD